MSSLSSTASRSDRSESRLDLPRPLLPFRLEKRPSFGDDNFERQDLLLDNGEEGPRDESETRGDKSRKLRLMGDPVQRFINSLYISEGGRTLKTEEG